MKKFWWVISRVERNKYGKRTTRQLGYVAAKHQPDAIKAAWKKWPKELDKNQTQGGFTARQHSYNGAKA